MFGLLKLSLAGVCPPPASNFHVVNVVTLYFILPINEVFISMHVGSILALYWSLERAH